MFQATQYIGEICRYLLAVPPGPNDKAHKVRIIIGNGLRPQIWQDFIERFNVKRVLEFYGATEGNSNLGDIFGNNNVKNTIKTKKIEAFDDDPFRPL